MIRRVLVISSVLPTETGGGELVLRRHLLALDASHWSVQLVIAGQPSARPANWPCHCIGRFPTPQRLMRTRLAPWLSSQIYSGRLISRSSLIRVVERIKPHVILTVAHGELAPIACWLSSLKRIPLVTLFHDWWPDMVPCTKTGRRRIAEQFVKLSQISDVALCVCPEMAAELGAESRTKLLYPIPDRYFRLHSRSASVNFYSINRRRSLRVAYAGSLEGTYGKMVAELAIVLSDVAQIDFRFCGPSSVDSKWPIVPGYVGRLPNEQFRSFLASQDLLVVLMSFRPEDERRVRTSFPSKLVEYCQIGLPILVWGPHSCSAVRWAQQTDAAEVVSDANPRAVVMRLMQLQDKPARLTQMAERSAGYANRDFHPNHIHKQFEDSLHSAITVSE
jgi:hypothetical protein